VTQHEAAHVAEIQVVLAHEGKGFAFSPRGQGPHRRQGAVSRQRHGHRT